MPGRHELARPFLAIALVAIVSSALAGCFANSPNPATPSPTDAGPVDATPSATVTVDMTPVPGDSPTLDPTAAPTAAPTFPDIFLPTGSPLPPTTAPDATPTPAPTVAPLIPTTTGNAPATRIVIAGLGIDLPVVKGNPAYPLCNVAQYMTNFVYPGQPGSTYIYGHARVGMFLPILRQSLINNGAAMIGMLVKVYTRDLKLHLYRIYVVKRDAIDFSLALDLAPGEHRLVLQTSEGPHGTIPKLQVAAHPIGVYLATAAQALPTPHPVACGF